MATPRFKASQHSSEQLVESAGAVLFRLSTREICVLHVRQRNEYVLPKGRRHVNERRSEAALREVREETGYCCRLLPVTLRSRAPLAVEMEPQGDILQTYTNCTEPFSLQIRHLENKGDVKLIWWFIAEVDESKEPDTDRPGEEQFEVEFHGYEEVTKKLTFQMDRQLVQQAINLVQANYL